MSRFDTNNISYIRGRYGLCWRKSYPTWHDVRGFLRGVVFAGFLVGCYGLVALNDARADSETAAIEATGVLVSLLNGNSIQSKDGHWAAKCTEVVEVQQ